MSAMKFPFDWYITLDVSDNIVVVKRSPPYYDGEISMETCFLMCFLKTLIHFPILNELEV